MATPPTPVGVWLLAIRPATLPAAVAPVAVGLGAAIGEGVFVWLPALAALGVALLLQVAANLANDLFDFRSGADAEDRLGPPRAAASGLLSQRQLAIAISTVVALAGLVGLYLVSVGGVVILVLGIAAIVSALAYTGGPWPYGYHALGEVFVFVFFGLVAVTGTAYLQLGAFSVPAFVAAIGVGSVITAILVVNNLRDIDTDRRAGKRTMAVSLGPERTRLEFDALLLITFVVPVAVTIVTGTPWALLGLLAAPLALPLYRVVHSEGDPRRLNPVLKGTARLSLIYALSLALGLAIPGLL